MLLWLQRRERQTGTQQRQEGAMQSNRINGWYHQTYHRYNVHVCNLMQRRYRKYAYKIYC